MEAKEIKRYCAVKEDAERLLETAIMKPCPCGFMTDPQ